MGVDTVKLSYPLKDTVPGWQWVQDVFGAWRPGPNYGTKGPMWWCERIHEDGTRVVVKGVGADAHLLWEQSVPKFLGLAGRADPDDVRVVDRHLRRIGPKGLPAARIRRCDLTEDVEDPDGLYRVAALGWNPHSRSRYVQAEYQGGETVWQHNKSRGVRVYDKYAECLEEWAVGKSRIEYQVRGEWCEKLGLDRLYRDFGRNCDRALVPLVAELEDRVRVRKETATQECGPEWPGPKGLMNILLPALD